MAQHHSGGEHEDRLRPGRRAARSRPLVSACFRRGLETDHLGVRLWGAAGAFDDEVSAPDRLESAPDQDHRRTRRLELALGHQHAGQNEDRVAATREDLAPGHQHAGQNEDRVAVTREDLALDHERARRNEERLTAGHQDLALEQERADRADVDSGPELFTAACERDEASVFSLRSGSGRRGATDEARRSALDRHTTNTELATPRSESVASGCEDERADRDVRDPAGESVDANSF
jgi:hypothetical protein